MWGSRWAAAFLMFVMLVPVFGPLAMPCAALPVPTHCMRRPLSAHTPQPSMPCHHAMAHSRIPQPESSPSAFQAANSCCHDHGCCCGATISEWAQPASNLLSLFRLLIEPAQPSQTAEVQSSDIFGCDSARAPPRS